ncbi:tetratricopeptide repeat-containing S1 family peptidase [Sphaerospermopsis reniformis]|nr:tetratricopeptide repeat-containing serine protease family protein [Sphaerospermopsis reniformis]
MMKFTYSLPVALLCASVVVVQSQRAVASIPQQVRDIADKITVRIDGANTGSGIIIKGEGNTYTVLTCWHVVDKRGNYTVRTGTGKTYQVNYSTVKRIGKIDLAEFQFTSNENYRPVEIGNSSQVSAGSTVYAFGWAAPDQVSKGREYVPLETTARVVSQPVDEYALVLSNIVKPGMSGGPILDEQGRLIGVSGLSTIDARLETRDFLGIPIDTYKQLVSLSSINKHGQNSNKKPVTGVSDSTGTIKKAQELFKKGNEQFNQSDYQGAIALYNEAIKFNPNFAQAYYNRGSVRNDLGDKQGAIDDFTQAIKINPNLADAYNNRGVVRKELGDKQGAIDDFTLAIKFNPNYAPAYNNRGNVRNESGDKQGAIDDFTQAIKINPNLADPYNNRGIAKAQSGDRQAAIADLQQAARLFEKQGRKADSQKAQILIKRLWGLFMIFGY